MVGCLYGSTGSYGHVKSELFRLREGRVVLLLCELAREWGVLRQGFSPQGIQQSRLEQCVDRIEERHLLHREGSVILQMVARMDAISRGWESAMKVSSYWGIRHAVDDTENPQTNVSNRAESRDSVWESISWEGRYVLSVIERGKL